MVTTYWQKDFFLNGHYVLAKGYLKKKWSIRIGKMIFLLNGHYVLVKGFFKKNSYYVLAKGYFF